MFDNGAGKGPLGTGRPGDPYPAFSAGFTLVPGPGTRARSWYLGTGGAMSAATSPARGEADRFTWSPRARAATDLAKPSQAESGPGGVWTASPDYRWTYNPAGTAAAYVTGPLRSNLVAVGAGAVHVWVKASAPSVDLQATISEVRPDGSETFVQSGWLRADERRLDASQSTLLEPVPTFAAADVRPLPAGRYSELTIPLYYEGHVYRRGSRIRLTISAPGGDQPIWAFARTRPVAARPGLDRPLPRDAVTSDPADRRTRAGADGSSAVPRSPRGTVPALPSVPRHRRVDDRLSGPCGFTRSATAPPGADEAGRVGRPRVKPGLRAGLGGSNGVLARPPGQICFGPRGRRLHPGFDPGATRRHGGGDPPSRHPRPLASPGRPWTGRPRGSRGVPRHLSSSGPGPRGSRPVSHRHLSSSRPGPRGPRGHRCGICGAARRPGQPGETTRRRPASSAPSRRSSP